MSYKEQAQAMDIIVVYNPQSLLHRLIKKVTGYRAGHVALYAGDGMIYEAGSTGVIRRKWKNYSKKSKVFLCRDLLMNENKELHIRKYCFEKENQDYAFLQLPIFVFKYWFGVNHVPDVSKKAMVCSEFVAGAYASAGIKICDEKPHETSPGDILFSDRLWRAECR